ncbi:sensor histidine kinase [Eshraghiella crossota]|uniref:sensor histidine kinase n=1 Tax=Eshraghiella crossota TaxID=45851 RepID=UPI003FEE1596
MNNTGTKKKGMRLKSKLAMVYILAGFLPIVVILFVNYFQMRSVFKSQEKNTLYSFIKRSTLDLDDKFKKYAELAKLITNDENVNDILSTIYLDDNRINEKFDQSVAPSLDTFIYFHNEVSKITIYTDRIVDYKNKYLAPIEELKKADWYDNIADSRNNNWIAGTDEKTIVLVRKMQSLEENGINGYFYEKINYDNVFEDLSENISDNYGICVSDRLGQNIYSYDTFTDKNKEYNLSLPEITKKYSDMNKDYFIVKKTIPETGWNVWLYKPEKLMGTSIRQINIITFGGTLVCLVATFMCIRFTAIFVTTRIGKLQKAVARVEKEDFSYALNTTSQDEIGELITSFSKMERKLNYLINEVYKSRIKEKEYEMKALQAQINPHFLYNTLSLINWKAIEAGKRDISKITLALSAFYRTSLNKGNNITHISGEIENMRSYLSIQLMLHDDGFDVTEDIDDSILEYTCPNLILQPLIENAIDHGIDVMPEDRRGVISVICKDMDTYIQFVIKDNGIGMTKEQTVKILTKDSKGYGVRNVNERLKLCYGEEYPMIIKSKENTGTEVIITIPKKN